MSVSKGDKVLAGLIAAIAIGFAVKFIFKSSPANHTDPVAKTTGSAQPQSAPANGATVDIVDPASPGTTAPAGDDGVGSAAKGATDTAKEPPPTTAIEAPTTAAESKGTLPTGGATDTKVPGPPEGTADTKQPSETPEVAGTTSDDKPAAPTKPKGTPPASAEQFPGLFPTAGVKPYGVKYQQVKALAKAFANCPGSIVVAGYTDGVGTQERNDALSQSRANWVKNILSHYGLQSSRMKAVGRGASSPVSANDTDEGRKANRRVTIACGD